MQKLKKRMLCIMLALCILAGLCPGGTVLRSSAAEKLVNVAPLGTASTTDGSYADNTIDHVIDGDPATNWQTTGVGPPPPWSSWTWVGAFLRWW